MAVELPFGHLAVVACLLLVLAHPARQQWHAKPPEEVRCPTFAVSKDCACTAAEDGLDFNCNRATAADLRALISASRFAIKTLTVADFAPNATCLCDKLFSNGSVAELTLSRSGLTVIKENVFDAPAVRLHSLTIHNAQLETLPRAVGKVPSLRRLDVEGNLIAEIHAYTFFGPSKLSSINLKDNRLDQLAENAFLGLENNLRELNLMGNGFPTFPLSAVKILKKLQSLNLAANRLANITSDSFTRLESLRFVDLSSNVFEHLARETFDALPNLERVTLAGNRIASVDPGALTASTTSRAST